MINVSLYHDCRRPRKDGACPVKVCLCLRRRRVYVPTGIVMSPLQWRAVSGGRPTDVLSRRLAAAVNACLATAQSVVLQCMGMDLESVRTRVAVAVCTDAPDPEPVAVDPGPDRGLLRTQMLAYIDMKQGKTADSYRQTLARLEAFADLSTLRLDELSRSWLLQWDAFMSKSAPSPNARAVYMRNLRAVINFAIDEGVTDNYPFRRFHIKTVKTAKRSLSAADIRELLTMEVDDCQRQYRDMFALSFYLMGINFVDMLKLPSGADSSGRIVFNRSKTKKLYSMKVEPEAQAIIDRYRGVNWLLSAADRVSNHEDYLRRTNKVLRTIGDTEVLKHGKKVHHPLYPDITTYWARHSWATIAASLDIPKETIAAALGHGGNTVTDIYIDFDRAKVDAANRRVIDWVLYDK